VVHEADEPNALVNLFEAEPLTGEHARDVDLFLMHADAATGGDQDVAVVEGIFEFRHAAIGPWWAVKRSAGHFMASASCGRSALNNKT